MLNSCQRYVRAAALVLMASSSGTAWAAPTLSPIWSDNAVIQRDRPVVVEGKGAPREDVVVTLGTQSQTAKVADDGRFAVRFAALPASPAPLDLKLSGADGSQVRVSGLVVGDVWLCSGQSNMEMVVERALDAGNLIPSSHDDLLRMITIPKATDSSPRDYFGGPVAWQSADAKTTGSFSAACYFMGKELRKKTSLPIGLIHASWGGSASRPWLAPSAARTIYPAEELALLQQHQTDPVGAIARFAPTWENWYLHESGGSKVWSAPDSIAWTDVPRMSDWQQWEGTTLADSPVGIVWMRRTVTLTAQQAKGDAILTLGAVDDMDMTWINGKAVGNSYGWDSNRSYRIPASYLRRGANDIVIAATNSWGAGGFVSGGSQFALAPAKGAAISLASGWRYAPSPVKGWPPRSPWDRQAGIGVMHNGMVAPIGHYAATGVAWYQGESDVGTPGYPERLKALFAGWREQFGPELKMLVVQLANFGSPQLQPGYSGWAELREAQRKGVNADANAVLVTAIDLGDRTDVHPANKNELGRRLALAALGTALPRPVSAKRVGDSFRIGFEGVTGALAAWSGPAPLGFELCGDAYDSCRYAQALADGAAVVLKGDGKPVSRVRYGWGDNPIVNLFDARPLPVPGFELNVTD